MTVRTADITATDWSIRIGNPGEIVTEMDDINQCVAIIITTRKGSDPHRPLFGCDAWKYLDAPASVAIPNVVREVVDSLEAWEARLILVRVSATISSAGNAIITIEWKPKYSNTAMSTEVSLATTA